VKNVLKWPGMARRAGNYNYGLVSDFVFNKTINKRRFGGVVIESAQRTEIKHKVLYRISLL
jgi:hypothetical protein